jgi:hypothetical protein
MSTNRRVSWDRPHFGPGGQDLRPPFVKLICRKTQLWVGDVLWKPEGETYWASAGFLGPSRYSVALFNWPYACEGHEHELPSEADVAKKVAQAEAANAVLTLHVNVKGKVRS